VHNGAFLSAGGGWTNASDRALKDTFTLIDASQVLRQVAALPIQRWHYRSEPSDVTHIGPVAQDSHASFAVGPDDRSNSSIDSAGVALAAIQGLNVKLEQRIADQDRQLRRVRSEVRRLEKAAQLR